MPPRKKRKLDLIASDTSLISSTSWQHSFFWIIWDFHNWPSSEGFELESSTFITHKNNKEWKILLRQDRNHLNLSLCLVTVPIEPLSTHIKFSIVGVQFKPVRFIEKDYTFHNQHQIFTFTEFIELHAVLDENRKMSLDGDLMILCELGFSEFESVYYEGTHLDSNLRKNMSFLLKEKLYSDFVIMVEGHQFLCHKAILACRSEFFANMFRCNMKESQENKLVLKEIDAETFEKLLQYIYTSQLDILPSEAFSILAAADRYGLDRLQLLCEKELSANLCEENALQLYKFASAFNVPRLKLRAERLLQGFKKEVGGWHYLKSLYQNTLRSTEPSENADSLDPCKIENSNTGEVTIIDSCGNAESQGSNEDTEVSVISDSTCRKDIGEADLSVLNIIPAVIDIAGPSASPLPPQPANRNGLLTSKMFTVFDGIPPDADVWCCTKNYPLCNMKWRIKDMVRYAEANTLNIKSLEFYSKDNVTGFETKWQLEINRADRRCVVPVPALKYLSLSLTCLSSEEPLTNIEYKFTLLKTDQTEINGINGMHVFKAKEKHSICQYYILTEDMLEKEYLYENTDLIICCRLMTRKSFSFDSIEPINIPDCNLSTNILSLLASKSYCDVEVEAGGVIFNCHKAVLASGSSYLSSLIQEEEEKSACKKVVRVPGITAPEFEVILQYVYSGICRECDEFKLIEHANKLGLDDMKTTLEQRLISMLCANNAVELLVFSDKNSCSCLRDQSLQFISRHLKEVMSTPEWSDVVQNDSLYMECMTTPIEKIKMSERETSWLNNRK